MTGPDDARLDATPGWNDEFQRREDEAAQAAEEEGRCDSGSVAEFE